MFPNCFRENCRQQVAAFVFCSNLISYGHCRAKPTSLIIFFNSTVRHIFFIFLFGFPIKRLLFIIFIYHRLLLHYPPSCSRSDLSLPPPFCYLSFCRPPFLTRFLFTDGYVPKLVFLRLRQRGQLVQTRSTSKNLRAKNYGIYVWPCLLRRVFQTITTEWYWTNCQTYRIRITSTHRTWTWVLRRAIDHAVFVFFNFPFFFTMILTRRPLLCKNGGKRPSKI